MATSNGDVGRASGGLGALRVLAVCSLAWPATAAADDVKLECSAAYDKVQTLRQSGKLTAARREALVCAREACTDFIKADCAKWVGELDASTPTVVFAVKDAAGADTLNVNVSVDGHFRPEQLDGKAMAIDPGPHKLRFEVRGAEPIEQSIVILQGAKDRRIEVSFQLAAPKAESPVQTPTDTPRREQLPKSVPTWAWAVGGAGILCAAAGAITLGLGEAANQKIASRQTNVNDLASDQASTRAALWSGGILLTAGAAGIIAGVIGAATALKSKPTTAIHFAPVVLPHFTGSVLAGRF